MGGDMSEEYASLLEYTRGLESKVAELEGRAQHNIAPASEHQVTSVTAELSTNVALLSMNATAEPFFVGATAGFSLSRMVEGILSQSPIPPPALGSIASSNTQADNDVCVSINDHSRPDPQVERKLVDIFFSRVHPRYPFLDKFSFDEFYHSYQGSRDLRSVGPSKLFQLYMVLAISARIMQLHPEMGGNINPEFYYSNATRYADEALQVPGVERVQSLLLLALYILRTPSSISNLGGWHIIGFAVRYAVELGMHRNIKCGGPRAQDPYRIEIRRRVFWSAYVLDRAVSLTLGRPFALSENDIDVDVCDSLRWRHDTCWLNHNLCISCLLLWNKALSTERKFYSTSPLRHLRKQKPRIYPPSFTYVGLGGWRVESSRNFTVLAPQQPRRITLMMRQLTLTDRNSSSG